PPAIPCPVNGRATGSVRPRSARDANGVILPASPLGLITAGDAQFRAAQVPRSVGRPPEYNSAPREYGGRGPCACVINRPAPAGLHGGFCMGWLAALGLLALFSAALMHPYGRRLLGVM